MHRLNFNQCHEHLIPGLSIQWGAIGDVGVVLDKFGSTDIVVGGTIPQRLNSCFQKLEKFMLSSAAVVSSYIPAATTRDQKLGDTGPAGRKSLLSAVCSVIGEINFCVYLGPVV